MIKYVIEIENGGALVPENVKYIASEDCPRYTSSIFFRDEADMRAYKESDHSARITAFKAAKRAREYFLREK